MRLGVKIRDILARRREDTGVGAVSIRNPRPSK